MSLLSPLVPAFPNNLTNGTPADASQVMADFNTLRNAVNTVLNATGATGGDQYVGLTTDSRFNGTSVHDALTQLVDRQSLYTDTGSTNAIVITPSPAMATLAAGQVFWFKAANTTTSGSATIAIGSNTAVALANQDGTLLLAGQLIAGSYYQAVTAGPGNPVRVMNPSRATGSYSSTGTGWTAGTTPVGTFNYSTDGKIAFIEMPSMSGTSNAATATAPGMPSFLSPATAQNGLLNVTNGGTVGNGTWFIAAGGTAIQYGNGQTYGPGGFSTSGTKTCPPIAGTGGVISISYPITP